MRTQESNKLVHAQLASFSDETTDLQIECSGFENVKDTKEALEGVPDGKWTHQLTAAGMLLARMIPCGKDGCDEELPGLPYVIEVKEIAHDVLALSFSSTDGDAIREIKGPGFDWVLLELLLSALYAVANKKL